MKDPNMADFFLRDKDGNHMTCTVFCRSMYAFLVVVVVVVVVVGGRSKKRLRIPMGGATFS